MKNFVSTALKGFGMGAANVVPGVSGGTIALITGIFGKLVESIDSLSKKSTWSSLFKGRLAEFWKAINGKFLLAIAVGILVSVLSLARLVTYTLTYYPVYTWAFFFGLILASSVLMFKGIKGWSWKEALFTVFGIGIGVAVCSIKPAEELASVASGSWTDGYLYIFLCGAVSICTMILPGVSGSFVLLLLGKYQTVMEALHFENLSSDLPLLGVFGLGCLVGIVAFAKFLRWVLGKWEKQTLLILLGFVLGSLIKVWPWSDMIAVKAGELVRDGLPVEELEVLTRDSIDYMLLNPDMQIPGAVLWCVIGIALVVIIELLGSKANKSAE